MNEIQPDDGSTVKKLGHDPWLQTDWQDLFEQITGSSEIPLQKNILAMAISNKFSCDQDFGETIVEKAAECGQLLHISVNIENLQWEYYVARADVISETCNWICIGSNDVLVDDDSTTPEVVSRDEFVERVDSRPRPTPHKQVRYIADNLHYLAPFRIEDNELKLGSEIAEHILLNRSLAKIIEAVSFSEATVPNEALAAVMEVASNHEELKKI